MFCFEPVFCYNEAKAAFFLLHGSNFGILVLNVFALFIQFFCYNELFSAALVHYGSKSGIEEIWRNTCQQEKSEDRWAGSFGGRSVLSFILLAPKKRKEIVLRAITTNRLEKCIQP
jgi:hypothetical protein